MEAAALSAASLPRYQFGLFTVDTRSGELRKHGSRVKLQERPFQLLVALLEKRGDIVSREELRQRLWPNGIFVDFDHSLSSAVNKLRSALGDSAIHPRYVETVGRRGYRFLYPVTETAPDLGPQIVASPGSVASRTRTGWLGGWLLVVLALGVAAGIVLKLHTFPMSSGGPIRSIAVLPMKNLSSDPEQEYFSEGLTDELITRLASLDGLRVISHTSVAQYKDSRKPLPEIAKELNVDAVLEGSVLRAGGRVRITAQLVEAVADRQIWAESYERDQRDILDLQNEVTRDIAKNIKVNLNPADRQRLVVSQPVDAEAYDLYLKGRYCWNKRTFPGFQQAVRYFQAAIAKDPNYARAYAGLADTFGLMSTWDEVPPNEFMPKARAAARRALEIDKTLAEAHTSLALIAENYDYDWQTAEQEYRRAIQLNPDYATAHQWYAEYLAWQGRFDEAFAESDRARRLDPLSLIISTDHCAILYFSRQYDRAIAQCHAVLDMDPDFVRAGGIIVRADVQEGRFADALQQIRYWRRSNNVAWAWAFEAYVYGRQGRTAQAQHALTKLKEVLRNLEYNPTPYLLIAHVGLDNKDEAIGLLKQAYLEHSNAVVGLKVDPNYDRIRSDPRFQDLLHRVGLAH